MLYNSTKTSVGTVMPLLMGCTKPSRIVAAEDEDKVIYDPMSQTSVMDMRTVGTYSLKTATTKKKTGVGTVANVPDRKNQIDDQKNV